ncbi:PAS domain S-box protein [Halobacterium noricense]|nr:MULTISPECIES: PAS domain S-box protein [Halobacterium]MCG1002762.1 PAS domain S-box protein [Halobacterium noricense]
MTSVDSLAVLCVDDDAGRADDVAAFLERADTDISTTPVASVTDAVAHIDAGGVDCVVSRWAMAGVDGVAFLEAVRASHPDLPFVLFAADGSEAVASDAVAAGVSEYVAAAANEQYDGLASRVRAAVDRARDTREEAATLERIRTALDAAPDAILVVADGEFVYANAAAADRFAAGDPTDLVGEPVSAVAASGDERAVETAFTAPSTDLGDSRQSLCAVTGEAFSGRVASRGIPWGDERGVVAVVRDVVGSDTDDHVQTRYRAAFEQAMDAMVVADDDGRYIDANESALELFDLSREELLGSRIAEFAPEDYDFDAAWNDFGADETGTGSFPLVRPDGSQRLVEYAATADIVPGEHLSVLRDVTERTRLEEALQSEQAALREMYRITAARDADFETKLDDLLALGCDILDVPYGFLTEIDDDTQNVVQARGDHPLLQPGASCPLSEAYCRKTLTADEIVTVQNAVAGGWSDDPAYDRFGLGCYAGAEIVVDGETYGTFCFADTEARDEPFSETERTFVELMARWASYEIEQRRSTERLRKQNERLEEFASMVSHDLRSPLNVARGFLDLARENDDPENFDRAIDALDRMERIVSDVLYLAREGEEIGDTETVSLDEAATASWDAVAADNATGGLSLGENLGEVVADRDRLCQLLENLFRNSLEHAGTDVSVRVVPAETGSRSKTTAPASRSNTAPASSSAATPPTTTAPDSGSTSSAKSRTRTAGTSKPRTPRTAARASSSRRSNASASVTNPAATPAFRLTAGSSRVTASGSA